MRNERGGLNRAAALGATMSGLLFDRIMDPLVVSPLEYANHWSLPRVDPQPPLAPADAYSTRRVPVLAHWLGQQSSAALDLTLGTGAAFVPAVPQAKTRMRVALLPRELRSIANLRACGVVGVAVGACCAALGVLAAAALGIVLGLLGLASACIASRFGSSAPIKAGFLMTFTVITVLAAHGVAIGVMTTLLFARFALYAPRHPQVAARLTRDFCYAVPQRVVSCYYALRRDNHLLAQVAPLPPA